MSQPPAGAGPIPETDRVEIAGGSVTLLPLPQLEAHSRMLAAEADEMREAAAEARAAATHRMADAGAILARRRAEWDGAGAAAPLAAVDRLAAAIGAVDRDLAHHSDPTRPAFERLLHAPGDLLARHRDAGERTAFSEELQDALVGLAGAAPAQTVGEADEPRAEAARSRAQAGKLEGQAQRRSGWAAAFGAEIQTRKSAIHQMGFDAPYEAARLQRSGPTPVACPLLLKSGEVALVSCPASLARMATRTRYVGGSQGVSLPVGHTGIRFRVGSFSAHPVQSQTLATLAAGTLVVTTRRLAFVGSTKASAVDVHKILAVEAYSDALAVFPESRENPDFYRVGAPQYVLFHLNWAIEHGS